MSHVHDDLDALAAGLLDPARAAEVEAHAAACRECGADLQDVRAGRRAMSLLDVPPLPDGAWERAEAALGARARGRRRAWLVAAAALVAIAGAGATAVSVARRAAQVRVIEGRMHPVGGEGRVDVLRRGSSAQTADAPATLRLGRLGQAVAGPGTRLARLGSLPMRIALERGTLRVTVTAPPRTFIVETPQARAIDLGCSYELRVEDDESGLLVVDGGRVELWTPRRAVIVPAGWSCAIVPGIGPGAPLRTRASAGLRAAVARAESRQGDPAPAELAAAARPDALTLLGLLGLVPHEARERVGRRLAALVPLPQSVTIEEIESLDPAALERWQSVILEPETTP